MKIGFCGTMSVGKTTLVKALKELPEFKNYTFRTERSKYLMEMGIPLNTDSTLKGQLVFAAERASELMQENIITDRTVVDVMAFNALSKSMTATESYFLNHTLECLINEYDYLFYISPAGVEMEDNGVTCYIKSTRNICLFDLSCDIRWHVTCHVTSGSM